MPRGSGRFDVKLHFLPLCLALTYRNLWQLPVRAKRPFAFRFLHLRPPWPVRPICRATEMTVFLTLPFLPLQFVRSDTLPLSRSLRPPRVAARTDLVEKRVFGRTLSRHPPPPAPFANLYVYTPRPYVAATRVSGSPGFSEIWYTATLGRSEPSGAY